LFYYQRHVVHGDTIVEGRQVHPANTSRRWPGSRGRRRKIVAVEFPASGQTSESLAWIARSGQRQKLASYFLWNINNHKA
jgi:hypothetical protein